MKKVTLLIPVYNEEAMLPTLYQRLIELINRNGTYAWEILFINDGSKDGTLKVLRELYAEKKEQMTIINFSRNFGKEAGLYAGLQHAKGDYVVIIDTDLQQPIEVAREMMDFLEEHPEYDEVAAYQEERKEGKIMTAFKSAFYSMINKLCDVELYKNASDFRCMRRCVVDAILQMTEYHRFSKGIFAWIGFETYYRPYEVRERNAGTTSWSFWKLVNYALEGVISFSTKPLKMATKLGIGTSILAIMYMIVVIIQKLAFGIEIPGYPTIIVLILLIGGIQLTVLGIIGEYLAKMHIEVKSPPIYIAKNVWSYDEESDE